MENHVNILIILVFIVFIVFIADNYPPSDNRAKKRRCDIAAQPAPIRFIGTKQQNNPRISIRNRVFVDLLLT